MKTFNYKDIQHNDLLDEVRKCQGKMEIIKENYPDLLDNIKDTALFDESYYSTKIEGIILDIKKCKDILKNIKNKDEGSAGDVSDFEQQYKGYAKVLLTINKHPEFFKIDTTSILAMFYALFNIPASYKKSLYRKNDYQETIQDNQIVRVRVSPVKAYETPLYLGSATTSLKEDFHILNIPKYFVDFMCIRPFDVGCGRIARLFMYLLLLKVDIDIVKYISLSKVFEANAAGYYDAISLCCSGWDNGENDYKPFVDYFLKCIIKAYNILFEKTKMSKGKKLKKFERIEEYFKANNKAITKKELISAHPDISVSTIENALHKLKTDKKIKQINGGRSTKYKFCNKIF